MNDTDPRPAPHEEDPLSPTKVEDAVSSQHEQAGDDAADPRDAQIAALREELAQAKDQTLRALAEADNTRRRAVREREDASKYATSGFAKDLLDFADNVRRAIDSIPDDLKGPESDERIRNLITGLEAMEQQMLRAFEKHGIRKIIPLDEVFNPNFHEVMFEAAVPGKAAGVVIQVIEPGYMLHDRLLRAARVGVAKAGEASAPQDHVIDREV